MENLNTALDILWTIKSVSLSINDKLTFKVLPDKVDAIKKYLKESNISVDDLSTTDEIKLNKSFYEQYNIQPYDSFNTFFNRFKTSDIGGRIIVILQEKDNDFVVFGKHGNPEAYFYPSGERDIKTPNYYYLTKIKEDFIPKIADYTDTAHTKYIFLSPECGKFELFYGVSPDKMETTKPLENIYTNIKDILTRPKGWEYIMKNRIIRSLEIIEQSGQRFYWLIDNLDQLIEATLRDYELFLTSHKHETIIEKYELEKDFFADKIRAILERISTNLLSIPITFSAALFGFREVTEKWLINIFLIALAVFVCFSCVIQGIFISELSVIKKEIYSKIDYFSRGLSFLRERFNVISRPLINKIIFLQILTIIVIVVFIGLYLLLANNYIDFSLVFSWLKRGTPVD
ncbi:hypothetical protein [Leadbettera azotonutricia]|uniref:Uncharacterized protein n=1 Tax=Leadbettera azotonutricia (strain ATCC BAA-888 / DSM 13862 / ZAS-9) TaxID=545695 RepID=F5YAS0_LEAAZ|nr:hypothetical protein [Leadbettera azotonutricia]AEF82868.1 hypothetical protein TREAZ_1934 [Leadbettera azotonutricia ZAS-9]